MENSLLVLQIPVLGLKDEWEAHQLQKHLRALPQALDIKASYNNNEVVVYVDPQKYAPQAFLEKAIARIKEMDLQVPLVKKTWPILHLSCAACASSSQKILLQNPGVLEAQVNFASLTAQITYVEGMTTPQELKKSLQKIGYDLFLEEDEQHADAVPSYAHTHVKALQRKVIIALVLAIPLLILGMTPQLMHQSWAQWAMALLATPLVFWIGKSFFIGAYKQAKFGMANMDTLVALSTGTAYLFSAFQLIKHTFFSPSSGHLPLYFESAGVVIAFILLGKLLEEKAKGNASSAIKKLMGLQPSHVWRLDKEDMPQRVDLQHIEVADRLLIRPGDKIPVDGKVSYGETYIDEHLLTGEPMAVFKQSGDMVYAGTINQQGVIHIQAEKVGGQTRLAHIIQLVQQAQGSKAPVQQLVDKISGIFVPIVVGIGLLSWVLWGVFDPIEGWNRGLLAFITVLIIACPCALGLATPTAIMVGIGKGAELGLLIKDAESLQKASQIQTLVLDKTGTITQGQPQVIRSYWEVDEEYYKKLLFAIENASEHPLGKAITESLAEYAHNLHDLSIQNQRGEGIRATYHTHHYFVGKVSLLSSIGIEPSLAALAFIQEEQNLGRTVVFFSEDHRLVSLISISDPLKDSSKAAIENLHEMGIEIHMLTGDALTAAQAVAEQSGIKHVRAEALPADKSAYIEALQQKQQIVAMVGDGINDSNALAQADVSIAMGQGSDIAMDVAQMVITSSDLKKIPQAIALSKATVRTIHQNLFWAFIYNIIAIPVAAGALYPLWGWWLDPMWAGAAMALSSVSVVSNSLRLKNKSIH